MLLNRSRKWLGFRDLFGCISRIVEGEEFSVQSSERGERRGHLQPHNRDLDPDPDRKINDLEKELTTGDSESTEGEGALGRANQELGIEWSF